MTDNNISIEKLELSSSWKEILDHNGYDIEDIYLLERAGNAFDLLVNGFFSSTTVEELLMLGVLEHTELSRDPSRYSLHPEWYFWLKNKANRALMDSVEISSKESHLPLLLKVLSDEALKYAVERRVLIRQPGLVPHKYMGMFFFDDGRVQELYESIHLTDKDAFDDITSEMYCIGEYTGSIEVFKYPLDKPIIYSRGKRFKRDKFMEDNGEPLDYFTVSISQEMIKEILEYNRW